MNNPYATYQQNSINTMTQGEMVVALYDGAIKQINIALLYMEQNDPSQTHEALMKTQDIVLYLKNTLNYDIPMSHQLAALYDFYLERTMQANIKKEQGPLREILPLLTEMKQAFVQADKLTRMK